MPRPPFSLRKHLALIVAGAILPAAVLTGGIVWRAVDQSRRHLSNRLVDAVRVDAEALDREFDGTIRVLQTMARSPLLDAADLRPFWEEAQRAVDAQRGWFAIILVDTQGRQLLHTDVPFGEPLRRATDPASLQQLVSTAAPTVGALLPGQRSADLRFPIRVPVIRDGRVRYALSAIVEPASLNALVLSTLPEAEEWTRTILDSQFTIAARSRNAERFVGVGATPTMVARMQEMPQAPFPQISMENEPLYSTLARGRYGWYTVVAVPTTVLDAPQRAFYVALAVGGGTLTLFGLLLWSAVSAQARAEEASRTKDHFLAVLGHELRNPLAPATTALELMKLRGGSVLKREREVLERQVAHMKRLVDDLLDMSRLSRGMVTLVTRRIELATAVERAVDMARPLLDQHGHALNVDVPETGLPVDGDEDRLVQVLINLLGNAAKYTPPGTAVHLSARANGAWIEIVCADEGPGIGPSLVPAIFEPFAQGPRMLDRQQGGLGLGLALSRRFVELHGGSIRYEPARPRGSRFIVRLPVAVGEAREEAPAAAARVPALPQLRILIVEDNADAREMLEAALEQAGHIVETVADGSAALARAATLLPDVTVLDIGLPGMDGYEIARQLRSGYPAMRLIALTGYGQPGDSAAARAAGFDAHCTKPVATGMLLERIAALREGAGSSA